MQQFLRAMPGRRDRIRAGLLDIVDRTPGFLGCTAVPVAKRSCRAPELCCDIIQLHGDSRKAASCLRNRRLHELLPHAVVVGLLLNPNVPNADPDTTTAQAAAHGLGLQTHVLRASSDQEIDTAFSTPVELKTDALLLIPDPFFQTQRDQFVRLAARYSLPTIYYSREYVAAGGLVSYGASFTGVFRQAGN